MNNWRWLLAFFAIATAACSTPVHEYTGYKYQLRIAQRQYDFASNRDPTTTVVEVNADGKHAAAYTWSAASVKAWRGRIQTRTGCLSTTASDSVYYYTQQTFAHIPVTAGNMVFPNVADIAQTAISLVTGQDIQASMTFTMPEPPAYRKLIELLIRESNKSSTHKNAHLK